MDTNQMDALLEFSYRDMRKKFKVFLSEHHSEYFDGLNDSSASENIEAFLETIDDEFQIESLTKKSDPNHAQEILQNKLEFIVLCNKHLGNLEGWEEAIEEVRSIIESYSESHGQGEEDGERKGATNQNFEDVKQALSEISMKIKNLRKESKEEKLRLKWPKKHSIVSNFYISDKSIGKLIRLAGKHKWLIRFIGVCFGLYLIDFSITGILER